MHKEYILNNDINILSTDIKKFFKMKGHYVVIRNFNNLSDDEIIDIYEKINFKIGKLIFLPDRCPVICKPFFKFSCRLEIFIVFLLYYLYIIYIYNNI